MDQLWDSGPPQTVRQVHEALAAERDLAYTTVMTVLQRLARKNLVVQIRDERAHQYAPTHGRDELVAGLMVDALDQAAGSADRRAALIHFVERVGADEADALRRALADLESRHRAHALDVTVVRWRRTHRLSKTVECVRSGIHRPCASPGRSRAGTAGQGVWPLRAPRAASCSGRRSRAAGVLSAFSAGLAIAALLFVPTRPAGPPSASPADSTGSAGRCGSPRCWSLGLTLLIGARLVVAVLAVAIATRRRRAHHRSVVDLLGECRHGMNDVRVLGVSEPLAYCLPGMRSRVVLSGAPSRRSPNRS